jgi:hypothetical protein
MVKQAKLYQRLRTTNYPWICCPTNKNGSPRPHSNAFQFGIRYTLDGQRKLEPTATLEEAVTRLKSRNVQFFAHGHGVALPEAVAKKAEPRTKVADAISTYFANLGANGQPRQTTFHRKRNPSLFFGDLCAIQGNGSAEIDRMAGT